ncbi:MAG: acyltransferase [Planctomyces sp.]|nr:acyltransferase [Planctomyces sp.]
MNSSADRSPTHYGALDGLRGLAAILVILSHTSNVGLYLVPGLDFRGGGKPGVFLFFLLSAFLLALQLIRKGWSAFRPSALKHYWMRRILRIYPLYFLYLLMAVLSTFAFAKLLHKPGNGLPFPLDMTGMIRHLCLLEGREITWSIAVEFKFYFLLPFLAALYILFDRRHVLITLIVTGVLTVLSQYFYPQAETLGNDTRVGPYLPVFLLGIFLASIQFRTDTRWVLNARFLRALELTAWVALGVITFMMPAVFSAAVRPVEHSHFHKFLIQYALLWSVVLFAAVNGGGLIGRLCSLRFLRFSGMISFGLYLFHPVFLILAKHFRFGSITGAWFVLLSAFLTATVSYYVIEKPCLKSRGSTT